MATIRDIAAKAGCSVSTVSRVLNNHPYVAEDKRQRILSIIKEMDYVPNALAKDLSYGSSKNIGVLIPYANRPYYDQLTSGILTAAFEKNYRVTLLPTYYDIEKEESYLKKLAAKAFDGIIIASKRISFEKIEYYQKYAPIVCCEDTGEHPISSVSFQRKESYLHVLQQLKDTGKQKIGLAIGRSEALSPSTQILFAAYREIFGEEVEEHFLYRNCTNYFDGIEAGCYFNKLQKVDAVFANSDDVAAGILLHVDSSVKVIGEENLLSSRLLNFSTVDHHLEKCGQEAFHLLFKEQNTRVTIPYHFIER